MVVRGGGVAERSSIGEGDGAEQTSSYKIHVMDTKYAKWEIKSIKKWRSLTER